jgi:uncharacterized protein YndB with AHSA1/START domain
LINREFLGEIAMAAPATTLTSVTVERAIKASPKRVYTALTTRDELVTWFCNQAFLDLQVNGTYLVIWNQEKFSGTGVYKALKENESLSFTWRSTWNGDSEGDDSEITISLSEADGGTNVVFAHSNITEEGKEAYEFQWNKRLDDLKLYLETGGIPNIVNRVIIGIFPGGLPEKRRKELNLGENEATIVTNLVPNYSAEKAGILVDDVIIALNGNKVTNDSPMNFLVANNKPGDSVEVTLIRGSETLNLSMSLMPYPVPAIPASFGELADTLAPQYDEIFKNLSALFDGVSEEQAAKRPAEGEWSAKHVLAHLIYSERQGAESTAGRYEGGQPQHWSGNRDVRLEATMSIYPTVADLLHQFRCALNEKLVLWRTFPAEAVEGNPVNLWIETFNSQGTIQHTTGHFRQITEALDAAKN